MWSVRLRGYLGSAWENLKVMLSPSLCNSITHNRSEDRDKTPPIPGNMLLGSHSKSGTCVTEIHEKILVLAGGYDRHYHKKRHRNVRERRSLLRGGDSTSR